MRSLLLQKSFENHLFSANDNHVYHYDSSSASSSPSTASTTDSKNSIKSEAIHSSSRKQNAKTKSAEKEKDKSPGVKHTKDLEGKHQEDVGGITQVVFERQDHLNQSRDEEGEQDRGRKNIISCNKVLEEKASQFPSSRYSWMEGVVPIQSCTQFSNNGSPSLLPGNPSDDEDEIYKGSILSSSNFLDPNGVNGHHRSNNSIVSNNSHRITIPVIQSQPCTHYQHPHSYHHQSVLSAHQNHASHRRYSDLSHTRRNNIYTISSTAIIDIEKNNNWSIINQIEGDIKKEDTSEPNSSSQKSTEKDPDLESPWSSLKEVILAFLLAGLGNIAASYWYGKVQSWPVFKNIPQLVILVTPLLGLKGNVEMTLASRLSTHANLGDMDTASSRKKLLMGNIALIQCQASTVGFVAPLIALGLSLISEHERLLSWKEVILLVASSVITANVANLILGSLMCGVVLMSRKYGVNPDNIATPIAASLGDVTTMILLANISHFLYVNLEYSSWVQNTLLVFLMSLIPVWTYIARKNPFTRAVTVNGWYPVCGAMLIQNAGGLVMERALKSFHRIANLQLLINGKFDWQVCT